MSCALSGSPGTCSPVATGQTPTPTSQCATTSASTCGTDGTCNGAGACRTYVAGTQCVPGSCAGSTLTPAQTCDGSGICRPVVAGACPGNLICGSATICETSCATNTDCVSPNVCNAGVCGLEKPGAACTTAAQCASGFCQQGVCCNSACAGTCMSCALSGSAGTCTPVPAAQAPTPATQCATANVSTCGTNGLCDGTGKCQLYNNGTTCVAATCTGDTLTPVRTCDGAGNCKTVTSTVCDPFACNTNGTCKTTCAANTDCTSPASCNLTTMSCGGLPTGTACATASLCASGFCVNGFCCNNVCTGTCTACNVTGSVGTCTSIAGGQAPVPATQCATQTASTCGTNGLCNGSGACQKYPSGTTCVGATCAGSTLTPNATCNGTGTCSTPSTSSCTPYSCGANACKTACTTNADCLSPYVCTGTTCGPALTVTVKTKTAASTQFIYFDIQLTNGGTMPITLSQITMDYWYTWDVATDAGAPPTELASCTYSLGVGGGSCTDVTESFTTLSPVRTNADHMFQLGFEAGAGTLAAGATAEIGPGINKSNFSTFTQTNDYSYNSSTTFTTNAKVTVYQNGTIIYGTEPM
jgi:Cellulose binding domain